MATDSRNIYLFFSRARNICRPRYAIQNTDGAAGALGGWSGTTVLPFAAAAVSTAVAVPPVLGQLWRGRRRRRTVIAGAAKKYYRRKRRARFNRTRRVPFGRRSEFGMTIKKK